MTLVRLTRSSITFAAVLVAYQLYVLFAVPLVEPSVPLQASRGHSALAAGPLPSPGGRYRKLLERYFPEDHWCRQEPPIVIDNGQGVLVIRDYQPFDDGRWNLTACAMVFFPTARRQGQQPPHDAIIFEAPAGAVFQFDDNLKFGTGRLGRIVWGHFRGDVVIRSDMKEQGDHDDLHITTRELHVTEQFVRTVNDVSFRAGQHRGSGTELEIELLQERNASPQRETSIAGLDRLEILRNVHFELAVGQPTAQPVIVTCEGSFQFDFLQRLATFEDNVIAQQNSVEGVADRLLCHQLTVQFAAPGSSQEQSEATEPARAGSREALTGLTAERVEATGAPVIIDAPTRAVKGRGGRLVIEIPERRATMAGQQEVVLMYQDGKLSGEVHAPTLQYTLAGASTARQLGTAWAAGPGWLRLVPDPEKPAEIFEAHWDTRLDLGRDGQQPWLALRGEPRIQGVGLGQLSGDELDVWLQEGTGQDGAPQSWAVPDRMRVRGDVVLNSPEILAQVDELRVWFTEMAAKTSPHGAGEGPQLVAATPATPAVVDQTDSGSSPPASAVQPRAAVPTLPTSGNVAPTKSYAVRGEILRCRVAVRDQRTEITDLSVDGNVDFREQVVNTDAGAPLAIVGDQLVVSGADTPSTRVRVHGWPAVGAQPSHPARVSSQGTDLFGETIHLDRGTNRLTVPTGGRLRSLMDRDLQGRELARGEPVEFLWQRSLTFDGQEFEFSGDVVVRGSRQRIRSETIKASLTRAVRFEPTRDRPQIELAKVDCLGNVDLEFSEVDAGSQTSRQRMQVDTLTVDLRSGDTRGDGPGWLSSVRLGNGWNAGDASSRLWYLRVDFHRGLRGNVHRREMTFLRQVQAVYGPVDDWEQVIDVNHATEAVPESILLSAHTLGVFEDPSWMPGPARPRRDGVGPVELHAQGNVIIEGSRRDQGMFTARANDAKYSQAKDTFILEGTNRNPALLSRQEVLGGPISQSRQRQIIYERAINEVKAIDMRSIDYGTSQVVPLAPALPRR